MADSTWQKFAKKGYLGSRAKMAAEAGDDVSLWDSQKGKKKHVHTSSCPKDCSKEID